MNHIGSAHNYHELVVPIAKSQQIITRTSTAPTVPQSQSGAVTGQKAGHLFNAIDLVYRRISLDGAFG